MPKMTRLTVVLAGGIVVIIAIVAALWWFVGRQRARTELSLYGNVDLRQVELPFNGSERIATVLVQEGDHVRQGSCWRSSRPAASRRRWPRPRPMWRPSSRWSIASIMAIGRRKSRRP